jgi:hypothetical protein
MLIGGAPQEKPEVYAASSPITYVEHVSALVLILLMVHTWPEDGRHILAVTHGGSLRLS